MDALDVARRIKKLMTSWNGPELPGNTGHCKLKYMARVGFMFSSGRLIDLIVAANRGKFQKP